MILELIVLAYLIVVSGWCGYCLGKLRILYDAERKILRKFKKEWDEMPEEEKNAFIEWYTDAQKNMEGGD